MKLYSRKLEVLKQEEPVFFRGDNSEENYLNSALWLLCDKLFGYRFSPLISADEIPRDSIEYALKAYDEGYDTILADGKLLGFRNGMPS
jgi:hypothetical protein